MSTAEQHPELNLTEQRILTYLRSYIQRHGYAPGLREIQADLIISSLSVVAYNLKGLERKGLIARHPEIARGIMLLNPLPPPPTSAPIRTPDGHELRLAEDPYLDEATRALLGQLVDGVCRRLTLEASHG